MPIPEILQGRLRLPVIGAPMFIVSTPRLVLAQCKAGIVGSFPALNARPAAQLDDWLAEITSELEAYRRANPFVGPSSSIGCGSTNPSRVRRLKLKSTYPTKMYLAKDFAMNIARL